MVGAGVVCAGLDARWDEVLLSTEDVPSDKYLESLCEMRICESNQLISVLAMYVKGIEQKDILPSYQRLKTIAKKFLNPKTGTRNFEARNQRTVTRAQATSRSTGKSVSAELKR